jgi:hypothetical protein
MSEHVIVDALHEVRRLLAAAEEAIRPDTEYLRDELARLIDQVDTLEGKVENERRLLRDKEALLF